MSPADHPHPLGPPALSPPDLAESGSLRLFFAVRVPDPVKADLARACGRLPADWRVVQTAQMHLTLVFLGEVPAAGLATVIVAGEAAARTLTPFRLALGGTDCFPNRAKPRVLFVHAEAPALVPLAAGLQKELAAWADPKPFRPHLTLARQKTGRGVFREMRFEHAWTVDRFDLVRSTLGHGRAEHVVIRSFLLGPG